MRYAEAIRKLFGLQARGMRLGIERMQQAIDFRGLDLEALPPIVQVAGTNGKGSVCAMLASALQAAGLRTGLFTSPHLHRFTERIRVDGRPLETREAARRSAELLEVFGRRGAPFVSFFELSTLMAVEVFRDHRCDVAVLEVGLGGRLDATTAFPAVLSVITRIARDHEQVLGTRLSQIAREKAGIIRPGVPVVVGSRQPEVLKVIRGVARRRRAPLRCIDRDFTGRSTRTGRLAIRVGPRTYRGLRLGLLGAHQVDNAACAVAALGELERLGFRVPQRAVKLGLARVRWPARLEAIPGRPAYLLDAAHNPDGCRALVSYLAAEPRPRVLVFGAMRDKQYAEMLRELAPHVDGIVYTRPELPRAARVRELQAAAPGEAAASVSDALRRARRRAGPRGLVVVAGSIFLVADARARILRVPTDPLIRL